MDGRQPVRTWVRSVCALGLSFGPSAGAAQPAVAPHEPSTPHERLAFFEGTWTTEPPMAADFREICSWLPHGRRHMVCRSSWLVGTAPREAMSVFSYDASNGTYLYHGLRPGGAVATQRATVADGVWTFDTGPTGPRTRVTVTPTATGFTFVEEAADGQGAWVERGRVQYQRLPR